MKASLLKKGEQEIIVRVEDNLTIISGKQYRQTRKHKDKLTSLSVFKSIISNYVSKGYILLQ